MKKRERRERERRERARRERARRERARRAEWERARRAAQLDDEIRPGTAGRTREHAARRFGRPVAAAVAAGAVVTAGFLVANIVSEDGRDGYTAVPPPGQGTDAATEPSGPQTDAHTPSTGGPTAFPGQAYEDCIRLAVGTYRGRGEPISERPTGRLAIDNGKGITVVIANGTNSYTCNIKPDRAVSHPEPLNGILDESDFWFAFNYTGNVLPGDKGDMFWAGGEAPDGVTGIQYTFPDGHTENAVVQDGFWALQYFSDQTIGNVRGKRVEVTVEGPTSQTFELPFTVDTMCNQVNHGC